MKTLAAPLADSERNGFIKIIHRDDLRDETSVKSHTRFRRSDVGIYLSSEEVPTYKTALSRREIKLIEG
jgi:hypothetical protein